MQLQTLTGQQRELEADRIQRFANRLQGDLLRPGQSAYEEARRIWNGMIEKRPSLIACCEGGEDVATAVAFAAEHNLLLAVRGGGHNVAGHALCDGGLVIDLSRMNRVDVDPTTRLVTAGGGAAIADLDQATQEHALAVPMGVVSQTGIAGLTLGGGIGWLRRKYGLSCDNLVGAEMVTAEGEQITVNAAENSDLLWGLRGGGGNFGVVTKFRFQAHPVGPEVMFVFTLHDGRRLHEALAFYRDYCAQAPDEVTSFAICGDAPAEENFPEAIHGEPYVLFAACYAGPVAEGEAAMQPLRSFAEPLVDFSGPMPYLEAQTILDADYPDGMRYYWKSLFLDSLSDEVIDAIAAANEERPSALSTVDVWHMGGAVRRVNPESSAFGGRRAPFLLGVEANWEKPENDAANIAWTRTAVARMDRFSGGGQYLNFPGFLEEGDETMRATFGDKYERLATLKQKYDPHNLFRLNQNIEPKETSHAVV